jgi:hypothetical protein
MRVGVSIVTHQLVVALSAPVQSATSAATASPAPRRALAPMSNVSVAFVLALLLLAQQTSALAPSQTPALAAPRAAPRHALVPTISALVDFAHV